MTRLCIVVPSQDYLEQAGNRIRYGRIRAHLAEIGLTIETRVAAEFRAADAAEADIYLLSKCQDVRGAVIAHWVRRQGRRLGVDLFDDYFSQASEARLVAQRQWLRDVTQFLDFALVSTPRMESVAAAAAPALPIHVMHDPFGGFDAEAIAGQAERNLDLARESRDIPIGWFGVGDNPVFDVGLSDLAAFAPQLGRLRRQGFLPRLVILTNPRAMTRDRLEMLRRLPLPFTLEAWSEAREAALIATSLACFLPVGGQGFSIAKSLNRAVSALTGGAQVLSAGFPLYARLGDFIYRDPAELLADIVRGEPRLRRDRLPALRAALADCADPGREAARLVAFLRRLPPVRASAAESPGVWHGRQGHAEGHKAIQAMGGLSIAGPDAVGTLHFDAALVRSGHGIDLEVSGAAGLALAPTARARLQPMEVAAGPRTHRLVAAMPLSAMPGATGPAGFAPLNRAMLAALRTLFPALMLLDAEADPLFVASAAAATTALRHAG